MILTGPEIDAEVIAGRICISPYDTARLEPNSYGFRLGLDIIAYDDSPLDALERPLRDRQPIPEDGLCLEPGRFYLGSTLETMGSEHYAAELHARRSTSTMGMWIQFSAPLGHTGAIIPWTLEIAVTHPIIVYPRMLIGKICFWKPQGDRFSYNGKYTGSIGAVTSRLVDEMSAFVEGQTS